MKILDLKVGEYFGNKLKLGAKLEAFFLEYIVPPFTNLNIMDIALKA